MPTKNKPPSSGQKMPPKLRLKLANECQNLLTKAKLDPANKTFRYYLVHSKDVKSETFQRLFALFESLMRTMYENSQWGWCEKEKLAEWKHQKTRILIVTKNDVDHKVFEGVKVGELPGDDEQIIAFMCIRFEVGSDKNESALYVYELHVDLSNQRQGLGEDLMSMARCLASAFKMDKIMLTVFRSNGPALQFYNKLKFKPDKTCPTSQEADYIILSSKVSSP